MGAPSLPTNLLRGDGRSVARPLPASPSWCPWPAVQLLRPRPTAESRVPSSILARPSAQWSRSSLLVPATLRSRVAPPVPLRCRLLRRRPQFPTGASPPRHPLPLVQAASPGRIPFRSPAEERRLKSQGSLTPRTRERRHPHAGGSCDAAGDRPAGDRPLADRSGGAPPVGHPRDCSHPRGSLTASQPRYPREVTLNANVRQKHWH